MSCTETYATLRIFSDDLEAQEIVNKLGLEPSTKKEKNIKSKYKHEREYARVFYTTKGVLGSLNNEEHLVKILDMLEGKESIFEWLRAEGCQFDIFSYFLTDGQGGPHLRVEVMSQLVAFDLEVIWDFYESA